MTKKLFVVIATVALCFSLFAGIAAKAEGTGQEANTSSQRQSSKGLKTSDFNGKRIGILTGTIYDRLILEVLPDAELSYFNASSDMIAALEAGKIDAFPGDEPALLQMVKAHNDIAILDDQFSSFDYGFVFPKSDPGEKHLSEFNEWLTKLKENGGLDKLISKWKSEDESKKTLPDYNSFPATNGTLTMVIEGALPPFGYFRGNEIVGIEVDLAAQFCEAYGYGLDIKVMTFDGLLTAVQTGKADFSASAISVTKERAESVNFSVPYFSGGAKLMILKDNAGAGSNVSPGSDNSFLRSIGESFEKTFVREERWKLFLEGVLTTLVITLLAMLFGTILGFLIFMLCRNGNPVANIITRIFMWLIQGMPAVVLLMVLYFIVFGSVSISGVAVSVIGFTLTFGAAVFGLMKMGVGTIDRGQYEAAYALGYSNTRTFFRIILPQALYHVLPAYKGEVVSLIKATAIVGYIAVQDLTKMGDIVRSRTYEAFFPLIAVTIIYFALEVLIGRIISRLSININPKRRKPSKILKGVNTNDQN